MIPISDRSHIISFSFVEEALDHSCRGVYFSKNQYLFTNPKNGPARESSPWIVIFLHEPKKAIFLHIVEIFLHGPKKMRFLCIIE